MGQVRFTQQQRKGGTIKVSVEVGVAELSFSSTFADTFSERTDRAFKKSVSAVSNHQSFGQEASSKEAQPETGPAQAFCRVDKQGGVLFTDGVG